MATNFKLEILTPDKVVFDGVAENVIVRTTVGDKGILAHHEPYCAALTIGVVKVKVDGVFRVAAISAGVIKVDSDKTTILAQSCEWADEIDVERANKAKVIAEEKLNSTTPDAAQREYEIAELKLKRAINRLDVSKMK